MHLFPFKCSKDLQYSVATYIQTRVTRLGDFSPIGTYVLGRFLKSSEAAEIFWSPFPTVKVLTKKRIGRHFGRFFTNSCGHTATDEGTSCTDDAEQCDQGSML
jgi:hypothetical protein